jgi:Zn-dependent peptidase ImmA (M78 family)
MWRDEALFAAIREATADLLAPDFECVFVREDVGRSTYVGVEGLRAAWLDWLKPWDSYQRLGRTQTAVSYWESGKRLPGLDDIIDLAAALGKDTFFFLPPAEPHQPVSAILRAEAARLDYGELDQAIASLLDEAEQRPIPPRRLSIRSRQPAHAANELIEAAKVRQAPVDVRQLAELCGALVLPRILPEPLSGLILEMDDEGAVIGVNSTHSRVRQRFSTAHELGHHLLRHADRFHLDVDGGVPPDYDYPSERAANEFAAELLMPRRFLAPSFDRDQTLRRSPSVSTFPRWRWATD